MLYGEHEGRVTGFLIRWLINALALLVAAWILKGIEVNSTLSLLVAAFVIGLLNAFLRPVILLLTLPLNILTLGLFTFVVNGIMIILAGDVVRGFVVHGFFSAVFASLIMGFVSFLLNLFISDSGRIENAIVIIEDHRR
ncbi:MAG: phage holin family protein [Deltaproteobacteria bacterium]|jgi:putative membrane protein|nr:phage holin family protein [Deltaproteobacteria bacterium]